MDKGLGSTTNTNQYGQPEDGKVPFTAPTPDKWGIANSILNAATIHRYPGWEAPIGAVAPNTVFEDPTRALAALHEQSNAASQNAAISGNSRAARANAMGYQNADAVANTLGQVANRNVQTSNQASDRAAQISNELQKEQAARLSKMYQENVISAQQYDNALRESRNDVTKQFQNAWKDRRAYDLANKTNQLYQWDPITGRTMIKPEAAHARQQSEYDRLTRGQGTGGEEKDVKAMKAAIAEAKEIGLDSKDYYNYAHRKVYGNRERETVDPITGRVLKDTKSFADIPGEKYGGKTPTRKFGGFSNHQLKKFVANSWSK